MKIYNTFTDTEYKEILSSKKPGIVLVAKQIEKIMRKINDLKRILKFLKQYPIIKKQNETPYSARKRI